MALEWENWSGSLRFTPDRIEEPESEEALAALVRRAADEGRTVRVAGKGHSSSPLVETEDTLVSLTNIRGVELHDVERNEAWVRAGTTLKEAGEALLDAGLAMHNLGDVNVQSIAGAIGTGTHGSGEKLENLSAMLTGVRMATAAGEIAEYTEERDPEIIRAARVALGALGIYVSLRLRLMPAFRLHRREWCSSIEACIDNLDRLIGENRNFDFYWYPRSDEVKLRTLNLPGKGPGGLPFARLLKESVDWSARIISKTRDLKFDEMEYFLPAENGVPCFWEVRRRVKEYHRRYVGWRVLVRTVAPDDAFLSPAHGRQTITVSIHQNNTLPYWEYFRDIEPILRYYGGRPHWGKKHALKAVDLHPLYPMWEKFGEIRRKMDPTGVFLNSYLRALIGVGDTVYGDRVAVGGAVR